MSGAWPLKRIWGRYSTDDEALAKILAEEPSPTAGSVPVTINFGRARLIGIVVSLVLVFVIFVVVDVGYTSLSLFSVMLLVGITLVHISGIIGDPTLFDVSITVSGEGIWYRRWFSGVLVSWWEKPTVRMSRDLTWVNVAEGRIKARLNQQRAEKRIEFVQAIRAWTRQYDYDVVEGSSDTNYFRAAASTGVALTGVALLFGAAYVAPPEEGVLGIRCSVNSTALQSRYITPERQGCVVLRVSAGAEKAGISEGDLVIEMNGVPITSGTQFTYVFDSLTGDEYELTVIRTGRGGSRTLTFSFTGGARREFKEDPSDPIFYYLRARGAAAEDPHQALIDYSRAVEIDSTLDLAWLYLADLYADEGKETQARGNFELALEMTPGLGEAHMLYAYYLSNFDDQIDQLAARIHIDEAISLNECEGAFEEWNIDCADSYVLLASLQGRDGDFDEMAETAAQSIRFYPGFANAYYYAACAEKARGDTPKALDYAKQYLDFPLEARDPITTVEMQAMVDSDVQCNPFSFEIEFG